jgi:DNA end-binding protein Ku
MPRALWKGTLSFGLVSIPVEVHTAVRDGGPNFHMLRASDRSPIRYLRVATKDDKPVSWDDMVKGYEYEKGRFIVLTKEDFASAALEKDNSIDILDFVEASAIDDRYFDKPYYLTPGKGGDKAYALLRETIRRSGRTGIAKFIMRDKQHLAAIEAIKDALVLSTLRFKEELVDISAYEFPGKAGVGEKDLALASTLVESFKADWDPDKYTDEYRQNLMRIIGARRKGKEARLEAPEVPREAKVVDLMERLRRSLEARGASPRGRRGAAPRQSRTAKRRKTVASRQ